jgi:hypothetical protein
MARLPQTRGLSLVRIDVAGNRIAAPPSSEAVDERAAQKSDCRRLSDFVYGVDRTLKINQ